MISPARSWPHGFLCAALLLGSARASAQADGSLPPLPASPDPPLPPTAPPPPPPGRAYEGAPPPPPGSVSPSPRPAKHAPAYALWIGARLGYVGFGGGFYGAPVGSPPVSTTERTSNLVTSGPSLEADVGVRLRHFTPFIFYERAILGIGSRFAGESGVSAYTEIYGTGVRFTAGDLDSFGFLSEISIGERTLGLTANGQTFTMSALEFFKIGLGAEIRLSSRLTLSPLVSLATGTMTNTSGSIAFSTAGSADGNTHPPFENGASIGDQRGYVVLSIACGAHFDLLGK
jgi:hypothetical protein